MYNQTQKPRHYDKYIVFSSELPSPSFHSAIDRYSTNIEDSLRTKSSTWKDSHQEKSEEKVKLSMNFLLSIKKN